MAGATADFTGAGAGFAGAAFAGAGPELGGAGARFAVPLEPLCGAEVVGGTGRAGIDPFGGAVAGRATGADGFWPGARGGWLAGRTAPLVGWEPA